MSPKDYTLFYITAASRDFGLSLGTSKGKEISLAELGRNLVYAPDEETEKKLKLEAFLKIEKFVQVLDYYKGNSLPEMQYLSNTLTKEFGLAPETHDEFSRLFRMNCEYLGIGAGIDRSELEGNAPRSSVPDAGEQRPTDTLTLAEPEVDTGLSCFVIMPFRERSEAHASGFFSEVLRSLVAPAGRKAGFTVRTANREGSDVIQSTIINDLLDADLVIADLTEHNPNVLFELGVRMAFDKPVALIRAKGTTAIFDVDNMLRVFDYEPTLWPIAIERDLPKLTEHIVATWSSRDTGMTYMKLLRQVPPEKT